MGDGKSWTSSSRITVLPATEPNRETLHSSRFLRHSGQGVKAADGGLGAEFGPIRARSDHGPDGIKTKPPSPEATGVVFEFEA